MKGNPYEIKLKTNNPESQTETRGKPHHQTISHGTETPSDYQPWNGDSQGLKVGEMDGSVKENVQSFQTQAQNIQEI